MISSNLPNISNKLIRQELNAIDIDINKRLLIGSDYRPNILINGDFQVWQRGTVFNPSNQAYCVDRWSQATAVANACSIIKIDSGVEVNPLLPATAGTVYFLQRIENGNRYIGKTLTFSVKINGEIITNTGVVPSTTGIFGFTSIGSGIIIYMQYISTTKYLSLEFATTSAKLTIEWAKLEVNDHATEFIPKPYSDELKECQRYYEQLSSYISIVACAVDYASGFQFKTRKRINPSVTLYSITGVANSISDAGHNVVSNFVAGPFNTNIDGVSAVIRNSGTSNLAIGGLYYIKYTADAEI